MGELPGPLDVREASAADAAALAGTLTRSFHDDPVQRFLFPEERVYHRRGLANFELLVRRTFAIGKVWAAPGQAGAALWLPPGADFIEGWRGTLFGLRSLLILRDGVGRGGRLFRAMALQHPHEPHWYLPVLGTDPAHQGRGVGSALLAPALARADADGLPAYLESSKEKNLPFYRRHGFEVVTTLQIEDGPTLWPMLRKPRARGGS